MPLLLRMAGNNSAESVLSRARSWVYSNIGYVISGLLIDGSFDKQATLLTRCGSAF